MTTDGRDVIGLVEYPATAGPPAWSPDGRYIAFEGVNGLNIIDVENNMQSRLSTEQLSGTYRNPAWSPDGRRIAFVSDHGYRDEIYIIYTDGSDLVRVTSNPERAHYGVLSWSPDGRKIAFDFSINNQNSIYTVEIDSGEMSLTAHGIGPAWSPDGQRIVFMSNAEGEDPEICVIDADGSNQKRLTHNTAVDRYPRWSLDGRDIVFASDREGGNLDIYIMNADGNNITRLTFDPAEDDFPIWVATSIRP